MTAANRILAGETRIKAIRMENEISLEKGNLPGMGWRKAFSIMTGVIWLSYCIIWLFFYADGYGLLQNLGIFLLTGIITIAANAGIWASFGLRFAPEELRRVAGWRIIASVLTAFGAGIFAVAWLLFYGQDFNGYQNLAVLAVDLIVFAGLQAAIWVGIKKYAKDDWSDWEQACH